MMKLHRHTSHENEEIRTNKWPQFVQDDVEHDNIYFMNVKCTYSLGLFPSSYGQS